MGKADDPQIADIAIENTPANGINLDLRALVRSGASNAEITSAIAAVWTERTDRYSDLRSEATAGLHKIEMSFIGG